MGSWNGTCAISNLHIHGGQAVTVFLLIKKNSAYHNCYPSTYYSVCPMPFYGTYNDYGGCEEIHGAGLDVVVDRLRSKLFEREVGNNESHDIAVRKSDFTAETIFEASHEGRLGIIGRDFSTSYEVDDFRKIQENRPLTPNEQSELDILCARLKSPYALYQEVRPIMIHQKIADDILNTLYYEQYMGAGKGSAGYNNAYNRYSYADLVAMVPDFVKDLVEADKDRVFRFESYLRRNYDVHPLAPIISTLIENSSAIDLEIFEPIYELSDLLEAGDRDTLCRYLPELLKYYWFEMFMVATRKTWIVPTGSNSQSDDAYGYRILNQSITEILDAEQAEYDTDNEFEDE